MLTILEYIKKTKTSDYNLDFRLSRDDYFEDALGKLKKCNFKHISIVLKLVASPKEYYAQNISQQALENKCTTVGSIGGYIFIAFYIPNSIFIDTVVLFYHDMLKGMTRFSYKIVDNDVKLHSADVSNPATLDKDLKFVNETIDKVRK